MFYFQLICSFHRGNIHMQGRFILLFQEWFTNTTYLTSCLSYRRNNCPEFCSDPVFVWAGFRLIHYSAFFGIEGHVERDLSSACPHRQFHTLPGLLDSRAALSNSYPNACVQCRKAVGTFLCWPLVWPGLDANPRPTVWEADTLTTKPTRHGLFELVKRGYTFNVHGWRLPHFNNIKNNGSVS